MTHTMGTLDNQGQGKSVYYITGKSKAIRVEPMGTFGWRKNECCVKRLSIFVCCFISNKVYVR